MADQTVTAYTKAGADAAIGAAQAVTTQALGALEGRVRALEGAPGPDLSGYASTAALDALAARTASLEGRPGFVVVVEGAEVPEGTTAGTLVVRTRA